MVCNAPRFTGQNDRSIEAAYVPQILHSDVHIELRCNNRNAAQTLTGLALRP